VLLVCIANVGLEPLKAQDAATAPDPALVFHDRASMGPLVVERWIRPGETIPDAFIEARWYEHATVLMQGRPVLKLTASDGNRYRIDEHSGTDINGDGIPDLIVEEFSGGAHCCSSTTIYAMRGSAIPYFSVDTEHCSGRFEDHDRDGRMEFTTCDSSFAYDYCAYAYSPRPTVVYSYDPKKGTYVPDTPRFARYLKGDIAVEVRLAEAEMQKPEEDRSTEATCMVLSPVLETIYRTGELQSGLELLSRLYAGPQAWPYAELQKSIVDTIKASRHFAAR
jgi:hypothetical protein